MLRKKRGCGRVPGSRLPVTIGVSGPTNRALTTASPSSRQLPYAPMSLPQRLLVISPVRNEAEHLERVVASLEQQTRRPDLWLIVDDHSTDATPGILRRLDGRIGWLRTASMPASDALDRG